MKRIALYTLTSLCLVACKKGPEAVVTTEQQTTATDTTATAKTDTTTVAFDSNKIPLSDKELGTFPYLTLPENYKYGYGDDGIKAADIIDADKEYFAVNGKLIPQQGKTAKAQLEKVPGSKGGKFNSLVVEENLTKTIEALGGIQVNNVPVPDSEMKRIGDKELIDKHYGYSIDHNLTDDVKTFIIRQKDKEVWIQFTLMNQESGWITILEKKPQNNS